MRIFILTISFCIALTFQVFPQAKNIKAAEKLIGNIEKIEDARKLINLAINDSSTMSNARTFLTAAKIEKAFYDNNLHKLKINNNDPKVDQVKMSNALICAYKFYQKALSLDSIIDKKGKIKTKYSKEIIKTLAEYQDQFLKSGSILLNQKKYYPDAYEALKIYADLPERFNSQIFKFEHNDSLRSDSYYKAGLAAYIGNQFEIAANAFANARKLGMLKEEAFINEIACYQHIAKIAPDKLDYAATKIFEISKQAYSEFGITPPRYINNVINTLVISKQYDKALEILNKEIADHPDNSFLYGLRGFTYDQQGCDDLSETDYRNAAEFLNADFETLKKASKKIMLIGIKKFESIMGNSEEANSMRLFLKKHYFEKALEIAQKAASINTTDEELSNTIEVLNFNLQTHF